MKNNPFSSDIFTSTWLSHFGKGESEFNFSLFPDLSFVKHRFLPLYINVGKTLTKGVYYSLIPTIVKDYKNKVFLIYDVPAYFEIDAPSDRNLKIKKIKQYPGYLINLKDFKSLNAYMDSAFNRKSRYKIRSYKKQLERTFTIQYCMYYGEMSKETYDNIFDQFRQLLLRRYEDKRVSNNNLEIGEWSFYKDVVYPMILDKKASMYVTYIGEKPIGIMLNFMSDSTIYVAMTVFDIDYSKFNIGTVNITNLIEWSIKHNFEMVDFSKGHYDYKQRWGSKKYDFEYHILYDSRSLYTRCIAAYLQLQFMLKQYLRALRINDLLHKITFILKRKTRSVNNVDVVSS